MNAEPATAAAGWRDWPIPLIVRAAGSSAAGIAIAQWPGTDAPYGGWFWLWVMGCVLYAASLPRAVQRTDPPSPLVLIGLVTILGVALALRLPGFAEIPANISIDELLPAMEARALAGGNRVNVFSSVGWFTMPNLSFAFPALFMKVLGPSFAAQRLSSVVMGMGGIVVVFLLARRLFDDRTALVTSFLMAVGFWHIHNSRTGFPFVQSSFWPALVIYLLARGRQDCSRTALAVAGLAWGFALQFYFPVRILLLVAPLFLLMDWWGRRTPVRTVCVEAAIVATGVALALGPILMSVPFDVLLGRSTGVLLAQPAILQNSAELYQLEGLGWILQRNLQEAWGMFTTWADVCVLNRSPGGLLDYGTLASVGLGILVAFLSGGRYLWLLLIWVGVTFVVGVAFTDAPRASYRMAAAMPAVFLLAGVGVSHMLSAAGGSRWYRCVVHPLVGLVLAGWITWQNYQLFFVRYAAGDGREVPGSAQLRFMEAHCDGRVFYTFGNEPPGPETRLFCSDLKTVRPGQLAASLDLTSPATFFVAESQRLVLERLRFCFPTADYVPHQGHDGRLLFTRVDVPVTELIARYQTCPG